MKKTKLGVGADGVIVGVVIEKDDDGKKLKKKWEDTRRAINSLFN